MYYDALKSRVMAARAAQKSRKAARMILDNLDVTAHIAPVYKPLHEDISKGKHTTYNLPGGRGSCKSSFVSLEVVNGIMQDLTGRSNAIVFRLVAGTMRDSVFSQIGWAIDALGVNSCGGNWKIYEGSNWNAPEEGTCPHCGNKIDRGIWGNQVLLAFNMFADANRELEKDSHTPLFKFDCISRK